METEQTTQAFRPTRSIAQNTVSGSGTETTGDCAQSRFLPSRRAAQVVRVEELSAGVHLLVLRDAYMAHHARPAQFANLYLHDTARIMPRPFGIASVDGDDVTFIFAVVGEGTRQLAQSRVGDSIDILGPLGNGFDLHENGDYLLVGGGLGVPPLIRAAQEIPTLDGARSTALFGYRNEHFADSIVGEYADEILSIDESEGNVITLLNQWVEEKSASGASIQNIEILSCGPHPMMEAVAKWSKARGMHAQLSLEGRMGCGFGTCVVCVTPTVEGLKKVCIDGPVFTVEQLGW